METAEQINEPELIANQWLQLKLSLRAELRIDHRGDQSNIVVIEDPTRGRFYQVGIDEFQLISSLSQDRTVQQAIQHANEKQHAIEFDFQNAKSVVDFVIHSSLARIESHQQSQRVEQSATKLSNSKWLNWINPVCLRFELFNPDPLVKSVLPMVRWIFSPAVIAIFCCFAIYSLMILFERWDQLISQTQGILSADRWYWLLLSWIGLKVIHESAHALTCRMYGGAVKRGGVLLLLFAPLAFVDVTSSWKLPSRWKRINVSLAGMYAELWIAFIAIVVWSNLEPGVFSDVCHQLIIMASVTTLLFNANPLMRFDGYFVLSDLLNIVNLYPKGQAWVIYAFKKVCLGLPAAVIWETSETKTIAIYGIFTFLWRMLLSVSIILAASMLWNGIGLVFATIAGILWFALPLWRFVSTTVANARHHSIKPLRLMATIALCAALIFSCIAWFKSPKMIAAPAIVQFSNEKLVRSATGGFVDKIHIQNGSAVSAGQVLFELRNEDIESEIEQLKTQLAQSEIQSRVFSQKGELASSQAETMLQQSLKKRLEQMQKQRDLLTVRAPIDGYAYRRSLENLLGSFVKQGDLLITVFDSNKKEVVVSISQNDLQSIRNAKGQTAKLLFPSVNVINGTIKSVTPRATDIPIHPSLCSNAGGPLPVRVASDQDDRHQEDDPDYRLLNPRFDAKVQIGAEVSEILGTGQRGTALLKAHQTSFASYTYQRVKRWLTSKIER